MTCLTEHPMLMGRWVRPIPDSPAARRLAGLADDHSRLGIVRDAPLLVTCTRPTEGGLIGVAVPAALVDVGSVQIALEAVDLEPCEPGELL